MGVQPMPVFLLSQLLTSVLRLKSRWTLLVGVSHVYVGHPHPTSSRVAAVLVHITVDLDRLHSPIAHPVVV